MAVLPRGWARTRRLVGLHSARRALSLVIAASKPLSSRRLVHHAWRRVPRPLLPLYMTSLEHQLRHSETGKAVGKKLQFWLEKASFYTSDGKTLLSLHEDPRDAIRFHAHRMQLRMTQVYKAEEAWSSRELQGVMNNGLTWKIWSLLYNSRSIMPAGGHES
ncbi:hypothetical protein BC834DRAFT_55808 [Gloeopeniophorella convolvens]|nr:hypothetical protein BC834DRAFT_55808 [Gloeopeniophorella convolvens]